MHKTGFFSEYKRNTLFHLIKRGSISFKDNFEKVKIDFRQLYIMLGTTQEEFSKVFGIPLETLVMFREKHRAYPDELHVIFVTMYNSQDIFLARKEILAYRTKIEIFGEQSS